MKKEEIRPRVKAWKAVLTDAEKAEAARAAFAMLERHAAFMMAENILMYHSLPDEISTHDFIDRWAGRKRFYLPRVNGVNLDILPYERTSLHLGAFSIEEPDGDDLTDISEIELIVVPGVAYDPEGNRVGRGKGSTTVCLPERVPQRLASHTIFRLLTQSRPSPTTCASTLLSPTAAYSRPESANNYRILAIIKSGDTALLRCPRILCLPSQTFSCFSPGSRVAFRREHIAVSDRLPSVPKYIVKMLFDRIAFILITFFCPFCWIFLFFCAPFT